MCCWTGVGENFTPAATRRRRAAPTPRAQPHRAAPTARRAARLPLPTALEPAQCGRPRPAPPRPAPPRPARHSRLPQPPQLHNTSSTHSRSAFEPTASFRLRDSRLPLRGRPRQSFLPRGRPRGGKATRGPTFLRQHVGRMCDSYEPARAWKPCRPARAMSQRPQAAPRPLASRPELAMQDRKGSDQSTCLPGAAPGSSEALANYI